MKKTTAQGGAAAHLIRTLADQEKVYHEGAEAFMKACPHYDQLTGGKGCELAKAFRQWLADGKPARARRD